MSYDVKINSSETFYRARYTMTYYDVIWDEIYIFVSFFLFLFFFSLKKILSTIDNTDKLEYAHCPEYAHCTLKNLSQS